MIVMITILSLPSQFDAIKPVVWMWDAVNNDKLCTVLLQHDLSLCEPPVLKESLLLSRVHNSQQPSKSKDCSKNDQHNHCDHGNVQKKKVWCNHCQITRHLWKECCKCLCGKPAALKGGHCSNTMQDVLSVNGQTTADERDVWFLNTGATLHMHDDCG